MRATKTYINKFKDICRMPQMKLKEHLDYFLQDKGFEYVVNDDGFLYAKGDIPILLTAHMDTVHKKSPRNIKKSISITGKTILSSPEGIGGDDRCGIYMIKNIIKAGYRPHILFCEDEEIGGVGSTKFAKSIYMEELESLKYMIELDRANGSDAVFYECENDDFTKYITKETGYSEAWGSFSDISVLAPIAKVAAVNLSCGYYKAHTLHEEVIVEEMEKTEKIVRELLRKHEFADKYEYVEAYYPTYKGSFKYDGYDYGYGYRYDKGYDDYYDYDGITLLIRIKDKDGEDSYVTMSGATEKEAWGTFFLAYTDISFDDVLDWELYYE